MNLVVINVVYDEVWGVQSDDSFVVAPDFNGKHDGSFLLVDESHNFAEVLIFHLGTQGAPIDLMVQTLFILGLPLRLVTGPIYLVTIAHGGNQIRKERNDARCEATLGQQIHLQLFHNNDLIHPLRLVLAYARRVVLLGLGLDQLHTKA
jgi:hypothetical protein